MKRTMWMAAGAVLFLAAAASLAPESVVASTWCGENGTVRLAFGDGKDMPPVRRDDPNKHGVTEVLVTAWLTDVDPVAREGEAFLRLGGYELQLVVTGAEPLSVSKELPGKYVDLAQDTWGCLVGLTESVKIEKKTRLVSWRVLFQGDVADVRFGLKPEAILTCGTTPGCTGSGTMAVYIGANDANMLSEVFGAGCTPAWLNPSGEPDLTAVRGTSSWQDVGRFSARD